MCSAFSIVSQLYLLKLTVSAVNGVAVTIQGGIDRVNLEVRMLFVLIELSKS
jgi:hypothetical protein